MQNVVEINKRMLFIPDTAVRRVTVVTVRAKNENFAHTYHVAYENGVIDNATASQLFDIPGQLKSLESMDTIMLDWLISKYEKLLWALPDIYDFQEDENVETIREAIKLSMKGKIDEVHMGAN